VTVRRCCGPAGRVIAGGRLEGSPAKGTGPRRTTRHAWTTGHAQQQGRGTVGDGEAEVGAEPLGTVQVRLLELQPGQPGHLDQGIARPAGMLPGPRAGLAVQRAVRVPDRFRVALDL
jgi:hypothetical protein